MGALSPLLRSLEGGCIAFWCPGCDAAHVVAVSRPFGSNWGYNGNPDAPTFTPSVLLRSGHYAPGHQGDCWCSYKARTGKNSPYTCTVCHSFVTDGRIQFLGDCTHALAGQTVPLPAWPNDHFD